MNGGLNRFDLMEFLRFGIENIEQHAGSEDPGSYFSLGLNPEQRNFPKSLMFAGREDNLLSAYI